MNDALPIFTFEDGSTLQSQQRFPRGESHSIFDRMSAAELRTYIATLWREAFDAKAAETERLKRNSLYYDGFHYTTAWQNRVNSVSNYCFSTVETVVPSLTEQRPRPEIVPRRAGMDQDRITRLSEAANWIMDVTEWDVMTWLGARDKSIYGWNCWLISFDYATGMPFLRCTSVFDVYPDPAARNEDELEYLFIATPVSTDKLKASYPKFAEHIVPDGIASPSHPAVVQPWQQYLEGYHGFEQAKILTSALPFHKESESPIAGSTALVTTGERQEQARTTMLLQLVHRDSALRDWTYVGDLRAADGQITPGMHHVHPGPCCESGWRVLKMTATGLILENQAVDDCYGGLPIVFDFDYRRTDRFWAAGELDNIIPLQRRDNRRSALIDRAVELAMQPPAVTNRDSGLPADKSTIAAGDVLRISRGSELRYLEFRPPIEAVLALQVHNARAVDAVSGVQDVQAGIRPAGIEAAAAIRRLQEAAQVRVRGKEAQAHSARARLLKKLMTAAARKLQAPISFKASDGAFVTLDPADMDDQFSIRFAAGSGNVLSRQDQQEKAFTLYQAGAIDEQELLTAFDWKNRDAVVKRIEARKMQQAVLAAETAARNGGASAGNHARAPAGGRV